MNPEDVIDADDGQFEIDLVGEDGGGKFSVPDGDYTVVCTGVTRGPSKSSGKDMFTWSFVGDAKAKNMSLKFYTPTDPSNRWKVGQVLIALGVGEANTVVKFAAKDVVGRRCTAALKNEEFNGRMSSKIQGVRKHVSGPKGPALSAGDEETPF